MTKIFLSLSLMFTTAAWAETEEVEAPKDTTTWVYQVSNAKDCDETGATQAEIDQASAILTGKGVRVLSTEQNMEPGAKGRGHKCGNSGNFVSCYQIFATDKKTAMGLGFKPGGLCGTQFRTRTH